MMQPRDIGNLLNTVCTHITYQAQTPCLREHMRIQIDVHTLGTTHQFELTGDAIILDLKRRIAIQYRTKASRVYLCLPDEWQLTQLRNQEHILALTEYAALADILSPDLVQLIHAKLDLNATIVHATCAECNSTETQVCPRCRITRYCSRKCQLNDWPQHKLTCVDKRQNR